MITHCSCSGPRCRLLVPLPPDVWTPDVIPPALVDTLAAVARDGILLACMPPSWGPAVAPILARLRPDVGTVLAVAKDGQEAMQAARDLTQQVRQAPPITYKAPV
jgi:hypothetical protein